MNRKIRTPAILVLLVAILLVSSLVIGCTAPPTVSPSPKPSPAPSPSPSPSPSPAPKPSPSPTATPAPAAQVIRWDKWQDQNQFGGPLPGYDYTGNAAITRTWIEWVAQATNGRLLIKRNEPGTLVATPESLRAMSQGAVDGVGMAWAGYWTGTIPEGDVELGLPFAWPTAEDAWYAYYRMGLMEEVRKIYAEQNVFPIAPGFLNEPYYHFGTTFPVNSINDIKGKKIRAAGLYGDYVNALGGTAVNIPASELYMALKLGTIDGVIFGVSGMEGNKINELLKYYVVEPNLTSIVVMYSANMDKWKALPEDIKTILLRDSKYVLQGASADSGLQSQMVLAKSQKEFGMLQPVRWSKEDTQKARDIIINTLWPKVAAKSARAAKLVDLVKQQMTLFGR